LKDSANIKIAVQCFENFGGEMPPPLVARLMYRSFSIDVFNT